jgi:phosphoenolpyruvate-protein kinase (PTS system EI component)
MRFSGIPVSAGQAAGVLRVIADGAAAAVPGHPVSGQTAAEGAAATPEEVEAAFAAVAAQRFALAERLRGAGRDKEAEIVEIAALIAADPTLAAPAVDAVREGADPAAAVRDAAERQAAAMEQLPNPALAERAGDIRQVAAAVVDFLRTPPSHAGDGGSFILVRHDVSPAELIELAEEGLAGAVSVAGGASSHAAIVARGLGVPMIAGADPAVLSVRSGQPAVLDADSGELVVGASEPAAHVTADVPVTAGPVRTADGTEITVLCNVASALETRRGLAAGAAGVGLLRTEIPYVQAADWPSFAAQRAQLGPILSQLAGKTAVVRLLDFSGDKIPPFLSGREGTAGAAAAGAGLAALLAHPTALADQLRAILGTGREARLGVLIPMVRSVGEISRVREVLGQVAAEYDVPAPQVGIMVELAATAANAAVFAEAADFFSIGTNDLAGDVLGLTRDDPAAGPGLAAHPDVLALVKRVADAGRAAGIEVSVCGDAAADLTVLPLLVGAGVRSVSVAASRVATVRSGIPGLTV